jgi:hypothetical protein
MTAVGSLRWTHEELVCFNLVRERTPDEVLRDYKVDPATADLLTRREADARFGWPPVTGRTLRAGAAGSWSFCLETWDPVGFGPKLLGRLSAGTDVVHYFRNPKGGVFVKHLRDEDIAESFELGEPQSRSTQDAPLRLAERFRLRVSGRSPGDDGHDEIWAVLSDLTGVPLDDDLITGPLATALRPYPS